MIKNINIKLCKNLKNEQKSVKNEQKLVIFVFSILYSYQILDKTKNL
jgi:sporulation-control protein spo0M